VSKVSLTNSCGHMGLRVQLVPVCADWERDNTFEHVAPASGMNHDEIHSLWLHRPLSEDGQPGYPSI
jgi:hypothetical protein